MAEIFHHRKQYLNKLNKADDIITWYVIVSGVHIKPITVILYATVRLVGWGIFCGYLLDQYQIVFKMGEFTNGLCGCFNNCMLCLITYVAPCYTAGKNAEAVGESCMMVGALYWLFPIVGIYLSAKVREKIRGQKGIEVSIYMWLHISWTYIHDSMFFFLFDNFKMSCHVY